MGPRIRSILHYIAYATLVCYVTWLSGNTELSVGHAALFHYLLNWIFFALGITYMRMRQRSASEAKNKTTR